MKATTFVAPLVLSAFNVAAFALPGHAATEQVLYNFQSPKYGVPTDRLLFQNGTLVGTGQSYYDGGRNCCGQVFELTKSGGVWTLNTVFKFNGSGDGEYPVASLIKDSAGWLYGTAYGGGSSGGGTLFRTNTGNGVVQVLWDFGSGSDGAGPTCDLVMDSSGNIYGTTYFGGTSNAGTVFELTPSFGTWTETVLYNFTGFSDGYNPYSGLAIDSAGALYGTTEAGGAYGNGVAFELTQSGGVWSETVLHSFGNGSDGMRPEGVLVQSSKGPFFGTTDFGGTHGSGTVFKLYPSGGVWKESVLYNFSGGSDGGNPLGGLHWNGKGALLGTTWAGGTWGLGTVFTLTQSGGVWSESVLHSFGSGSDGNLPYGAVILDKSGNLYGTTAFGGTAGYGTVWEVTP